MVNLSLNSNSISEADLVIIGFPDDSKSHAERKGANKGPDYLRTAYNNSLYFEREGNKIPIISMLKNKSAKRIFDVGNVSRDDLYRLSIDVLSLDKIPIILGGDHSLTTIMLKSMKNRYGKKISLIYFDAHPDFVSSTKDYYGSVLSDAADCIDFNKSILVGTRAVEQEELDNMNRNLLEHISPIDILVQGPYNVADKIISKCDSQSYVYISIDLDCIEPGIAPGVSVPTACGLTPLELIYLIKKVCSNLSVIGLDIVELCPAYDINHITSNTAARILFEAITSLSSIKIK